MKPSPIIAGTMKWGVWGANMKAAEMAGHIEVAIAAGVHTFDHADIYGGYTTEAAFGEAFALADVRREEVEFISKCGICYPSDGTPNAVKRYDYSAAHIRRSAENSLRNLQTPYLDLFLLHRPSPLLDPREAVDELERLQSEGKIRSWGVSNFTPSQLALVSTCGQPAWNQIECSLTRTEPMTDGTLDHHQVHEIGTMAWSPMGTLFTSDSPQTDRIQKTMHRLVEQYNAPVEVILLAWLMRHPAGIVPVVGTTRSERYTTLISAKEISLSDEDWFALTEASWGHKVP
jgi:predicted oxidoreductase